ncbi:HEPN domain-containing protein [Helicobacter pylori]|uniref:HEPN domain-containing protein n=1 Tax=Helicobacter pylori TaxID=210 RepID=UPI001ABAAC49|nr:HEPN domain-containing protein [Helicobacter pylori]
MITSLGGVEYFERQCLAFLKNPQIHHDQKEKILGVFSYQENKISFSFVVLGEIKEIHSLQYQTLYIMDNTKRYTLYKLYDRIILGHALGHPAPITLYYEWLFDDWIDPEKIMGDRFNCRTNYLESFFTTKKHLLPDALFKVDESGCESYHGDKNKDFILQSFYIQNDFLSQKYEEDKIKAKSNLVPKRQNRLLTYQFDLFLECDMIFETLEELALIAEAIKNSFVLIYAHSNFDIQIDYIQFKLSNKNITAIRNTYKKDKKSIEIDPYGIAINFQQIDNFSVILEKWIDFYIKDNRGFQLASILDIINKKDPIIHLYSDMFVLIGMIESFLKKLQKTKLREKLSEFFKISLSMTKCDQTKNYFNDKCQEYLIQQIVDCRNNLAHGDDLKLDTNKATDISHAFMDFKQIVIEFFFGKIELSDFITNNFGFLNKVKLRILPKTEKIAEPNR